MEFFQTIDVEQMVVDFFQSAGIAEDQGKYVFCLLIAYPLGYLFLNLPNQPTLKHFVGMLIGIWFAWFTMKWQILHSFISSTIVYAIMKIFPRNQQHWIVFAFAMTYLSVSHIYRMYTDYLGWSMDFTGPQMLLTLKLTSFAFDYFDGLSDTHKNSFRQEMCLKQLPSLLEFYGYVYFFGGFLAGPAFNMKEYLCLVDMTYFKDPKTGKIHVPSPLVPAATKFLQGLLLAVGVHLGMIYSLRDVEKSEFDTFPLYYKMFFVWFATLLKRFPYYFAWFLSEGSCILAGFGFNGYDKNGHPKWDRATNVKILSLELAQNFKEITESWNIRTNTWLKQYIHERTPKFKVGLTFLTSALWHGFYPGYYFSFLSASFIISGMRIIRKNIRSLFLQKDQTPGPYKPIYDIICLLSTTFMLNYNMAPFVLLDFETSFKVWRSLYFIGHILLALVVGFAIIVGPPKKPKKEQ